MWLHCSSCRLIRQCTHTSPPSVTSWTGQRAAPCGNRRATNGAISIFVPHDLSLCCRGRVVVFLTRRQQLRAAQASAELMPRLLRHAHAMLIGWGGLLMCSAVLLLAAALIGSSIAAGQFGNDVSSRCCPFARPAHAPLQATTSSVSASTSAQVCKWSVPHVSLGTCLACRPNRLPGLFPRPTLLLLGGA
jgi:hypothetical protein